MKCKSLIAKAVALVIFFVSSYFISSAQDSCCKPPDSLKVVSVTSTQFCVSWIIKPVVPPCDSVVSSTIRYRKVGLDAWTTQTITLTNGQLSVLFCASAVPCTQYEWEVKNNCKRSDSVVVSSTWVTGPNFATPCDTSSCCTPDSLKLVSLTANSFCVSWKIKDSAACDSAIGAVLQFRPVGFRFWKTVTVYYSPGTTSYTYCDSVIPCTTYEWQVKTICYKNGVTSYSGYVSGPKFTTPCFRSSVLAGKAITPLQISITPNPATDQILIRTNKGEGLPVTFSITDAAGRTFIKQQRVLQQKTAAASIDISKLLPGLYFIKLEAGGEKAVGSFVKQ